MMVDFNATMPEPAMLVMCAFGPKPDMDGNLAN
jgi:hypothetical protein